jgi:hypothetical protein
MCYVQTYYKHQLQLQHMVHRPTLVCPDHMSDVSVWYTHYEYEARQQRKSTIELAKVLLRCTGVTCTTMKMVYTFVFSLFVQCASSLIQLLR